MMSTDALSTYAYTPLLSRKDTLEEVLDDNTSIGLVLYYLGNLECGCQTWHVWIGPAGNLL